LKGTAGITKGREGLRVFDVVVVVVVVVFVVDPAVAEGREEGRMM